MYGENQRGVVLIFIIGTIIILEFMVSPIPMLEIKTHYIYYDITGSKFRLIDILLMLNSIIRLRFNFSEWKNL